MRNVIGFIGRFSLVNTRERQRKKRGLKRRYNTLSYQLQDPKAMARLIKAFKAAAKGKR